MPEHKALDAYSEMLDEMKSNRPEKAELLLRYIAIHFGDCETCKPHVTAILAHVKETMCPYDSKFLFEGEKQDA